MSKSGEDIAMASTKVDTAMGRRRGYAWPVPGTDRKDSCSCGDSPNGCMHSTCTCTRAVSPMPTEPGASSLNCREGRPAVVKDTGRGHESNDGTRTQGTHGNFQLWLRRHANLERGQRHLQYSPTITTTTRGGNSKTA